MSEDGLKLDDVKTMNSPMQRWTFYRLRRTICCSTRRRAPHEVGKPSMWMGEIEECAFQNHSLRVRPGLKSNPASYSISYVSRL